tara:strand:- start:70 stop:453 length:384 start_codon:yes stop_codon:yes gene_type:complete
MSTHAHTQRETKKMSKEIKIGNGQSILVRDADYAHAASFKWYAVSQRDGGVIARRSMTEKEVAENGGVRRTVLAAQFVHGVPQDTILDFIDGDGTNLLPENIRILTVRQQSVRDRGLRSLASIGALR